MPAEPDNPTEVQKGENPFAAPQTEPTPLRGGWRRVLIVVLGVLLTPVAALIGGFCCCFAGATVGSAFNPRNYSPVIELAVGGFLLGAIGAAVLTVLGFRRLWKRGAALIDEEG